jgi:rhodanese-related sulfurtransferase
MSIFQRLFGASGKTDLKNIIEQGAFLVDVRTAAEFERGHVKGSVNIPLDKIPTQLAQFRSRKNIIVFCLSGGRSGQAKSILERNGIQGVINGGTWRQVNQFVK